MYVSPPPLLNSQEYSEYFSKSKSRAWKPTQWIRRELLYNYRYIYTNFLKRHTEWGANRPRFADLLVECAKDSSRRTSLGEKHKNLTASEASVALRNVASVLLWVCRSRSIFSCSSCIHLHVISNIFAGIFFWINCLNFSMMSLGSCRIRPASRMSVEVQQS